MLQEGECRSTASRGSSPADRSVRLILRTTAPNTPVPLELGSLITLDIEKPVVGGRMLARLDGQVVLVWGAIPGERVRARIERIGRGVLYADSVEVLEASSDRRDAGPDWRCGGNVYAHIAYDRQVRLKGEIIRETFGRIGRLPLNEQPTVMPSPERGYRMRARLHARDGRLGFYREGTHNLCDPAATNQLLPETLAWIAEVERFLHDNALSGLASVELTENIPANERACSLELQSGVDAGPFAPLTGVTVVSDTLSVREDDETASVAASAECQIVFSEQPFSARTARQARGSARAPGTGHRSLCGGWAVRLVARGGWH